MASPKIDKPLKAPCKKDNADKGQGDKTVREFIVTNLLPSTYLCTLVCYLSLSSPNMDKPLKAPCNKDNADKGQGVKPDGEFILTNLLPSTFLCRLVCYQSLSSPSPCQT